MRAETLASRVGELRGDVVNMTPVCWVPRLGESVEEGRPRFRTICALFGLFLGDFWGPTASLTPGSGWDDRSRRGF